jgi:hypothetical protein
LRAGSVVDRHYDGYSVLRTIESALGLGSLGRFDQFAEPLNAIFAQREEGEESSPPGLRPSEAAATRGSLDDTFGRPTTPASVDEGQPLALQAATGIDDDTVVNLEPLGQVPGDTALAYRLDRRTASVSIPTRGRAPGFYGAWLRHGRAPPHLAPLMVSILPRGQLSPEQPGVEFPGATGSAEPAATLKLREGANVIVRYCRPAGAAAADSWIGIFPAGTKPDQMTQANANAIGHWVRTPGSPLGAACGATLTYAAGLRPGQGYQILLFRNAPDGTATAIGRAAAFDLTPALPR